jgi:hypothetical protein
MCIRRSAGWRKAMSFVGRHKEMQRVMSLLSHNSSVIVSGQYGIGRTRLIRHIAGLSRDRWQFIFVDGSQTPLNITRELLMGLQSTKTRKRRIASGSYRILRSRFLNFDLQGMKQPVLVVDNIASLSPQKLSLIRYLNSEGNKFLFIAIIEQFLQDRELFLLRSQMMPVEMIRLSYLNAGEAVEYFSMAAKQNLFCWSEGYMRMLVKSTHGYPLGMVNAVRMIMERNQPDKSQETRKT